MCPPQQYHIGGEVISSQSVSNSNPLIEQLERNVILRDQTGKELLERLKSTGLAGRIPYVPRRIEEREWRNGKGVIVSLLNPSGGSQTFCVTRNDGLTIIRSPVDESTLIPKGTILYAARG